MLLTTDTVGGVWSFALQLSSVLGTAGIDVALATMGPLPSADQRRHAARLRNVALHESAFRLEWMPDASADVERAAVWLTELADRVRPDVVHSNSYAHGACEWPAAVVVGGHSCVYSWWEAVKGGEPPPEWRAYRDRTRHGLRAADVVVAPSRAMRDALVRHYGPLPAVRVVHNGSENPGSAAVHEAEYICAAGRIWDEAKNISLLDRVAANLTWPVIVAGDTASPGQSRFEARHLRLTGRLDAPDMHRLLAEAPVFAAPAKYEPFGLAVLEAAIAKCALVLADIPSFRELWDGAAEFVAPDDVPGWTTRLRALIADPARRAALAEAARGRARAFTPRRMLDGYLDAYAAAIAAHAARHPVAVPHLHAAN